jgi:hypothetical protein
MQQSNSCKKSLPCSCRVLWPLMESSADGFFASQVHASSAAAASPYEVHESESVQPLHLQAISLIDSENKNSGEFPAGLHSLTSTAAPCRHTLQHVHRLSLCLFKLQQQTMCTAPCCAG